MEVEVNVDGALCEMNNLLCSISAAAKCANCICQRNEPGVQIMCTSHTHTHMHTCILLRCRQCSYLLQMKFSYCAGAAAVEFRVAPESMLY